MQIWRWCLITGAAGLLAACSPPDTGLTEAARKTLTAAQQRSFAQDREFCGMLGRTADGRIIATSMERGLADSCVPLSFDEDVEPLASFHTHGSYDVEADAEVPSSSDVEADMAEGVVGFISTPGGRFWRINPNTGVSQLICGEGCLPVDPDYVVDPDDPIAQRYTIDDLFDREEGF